MSHHVWRPFLIILILFALFLMIRNLIVPRDFKVYDKGFMYGYHRGSNEAEWANFKIKYKGREYCSDCHEEFEKIKTSPHTIIQCENCHGPAVDHPDKPEKLPIDHRRELCLRCHTRLLYPTSMRSEIKGIDPETHYPKAACYTCHNPHHPNLEDKKK